MRQILPVIICGGSGTRMWPLSRESLPKQFLPLIDEQSSFQERLLMLAGANIFQAPLAISNIDYRFMVGEQMRQVGVNGKIVLEPERRDSGPAIAVAAERAFRQNPETIVAMFAGDDCPLRRSRRRLLAQGRQTPFHHVSRGQLDAR